MVISIDGPTASGKSTVAKLLAQNFGYDYLYTGLLYRALAYILVEKFGYSRDNLRSPKYDDIINVLHSPEFKYTYSVKDGPAVYYKGENITSYLKTAEVDDWSSLSSVDEKVREEMVAYQRAYVDKHDAVVEGRDVGTVVFPDSPYKFYLTASLEERARRWQKDQKKYGNTFTLEESMALIDERDERDKNRKISPLRVSEGAIVIDGTNLSLQAIIEFINTHLTHKVPSGPAEII